MLVQILGTGCQKCKTLTENAEKAVRDLGIDAHIEKVTEIRDIMQFKVMMTPALAIDGEVKAAGRLLSPTEIADLLQAAQGPK